MPAEFMVIAMTKHMNQPTRHDLAGSGTRRRRPGDEEPQHYGLAVFAFLVLCVAGFFAVQSWIHEPYEGEQAWYNAMRYGGPAVMLVALLVIFAGIDVRRFLNKNNGLIGFVGMAAGLIAILLFIASQQQ